MCLCKICNGTSSFAFSKQVLGRYQVSYFQCNSCGFIQTETPYWLNEAYSSAIADTDIGYITRNLVNRNIVSSLINTAFNSKGRFLDYGGGYGLFVRLMRDAGYDFYRQDKFCNNLFAQQFDIKSFNTINLSFDLLTAFEVFEHLENPVQEFENMLEFSKSILFSTELVPQNNVSDWIYLSPHTGQHISFFSKQSLDILAEKYNLNLYTNGKNLHLLTPLKMTINKIKFISMYHTITDKLLHRYFYNRKTLLYSDYQSNMSLYKSK
ncbi:MAG: class I SAM-dependent methyltransferase [Bacteroidales bacterium]|nr:class I SAM-dependent methyltransferase [Bacteroidales bacterium]